MCEKLPAIMEYLGPTNRDAVRGCDKARDILIRRISEGLNMVIYTDVFR